MGWNVRRGEGGERKKEAVTSVPLMMLVNREKKDNKLMYEVFCKRMNVSRRRRR